MNEKIIDIAKITFALIFVVLLALFMSTITSKGNSANTKLIDTLESVGGTSLNSYDNVQMKGEAVVNAIRNIKTIGENVKLQIDVYTLENTNGTAYGYKNGANTITHYTKLDNSDPNYINPSADFESHIVVNENEVPIGIVFAQLDKAGKVTVTGKWGENVHSMIK